MRTNIVLDDKLVKEEFKYAKVRTRRDLVHQALTEFVEHHRRKSITVRSTIDCLVAQLAIENKLILLHDDRDFIQIAGAEQKLKLFSDK